MSIEGYKPFGKKQTFRLAPITLVYGPNSGGKSSLLEAIQILLASPEKGIIVPGLDHVGPSANLLHSWEGGHRFSKVAIHGMLSCEGGRRYYNDSDGFELVADVYGLVIRTPISRVMGFVSDEPQYDQSGNLVPEEPSGEFYLDRDLMKLQAEYDQGKGQGVPPWLVEKHFLDPARTIEITDENCEALGFDAEEVWRDGPNPRLFFHDGPDGDGPSHTRVNPENGYWEHCKDNQLDPNKKKELRLIDDELLWEIITKTGPYISLCSGRKKYSDVITPQFVEGVVKDIISNLRYDIPAHKYCWDGDPESPTLELLYLAKKYCEIAWWKVSKKQHPDDIDPSYNMLHEAIDYRDVENTHPYCLGCIHLSNLASYTFLDPPDARASEFSSLRARLESEKDEFRPAPDLSSFVMAQANLGQGKLEKNIKRQESLVERSKVTVARSAKQMLALKKRASYMQADPPPSEEIGHYHKLYERECADHAEAEALLIECELALEECRKEFQATQAQEKDLEAEAFIHWLTTVLPLDPSCCTFPANSDRGALTVVPALRPEPVTWWASSEYPYHDVDEKSVSECFSMLGLDYKFRSKESPHDDIGPGSSAILVDSKGREINLRHTGTGISQVLPVVAALASNKDMVLLKQPELHLHPRQQGDLADVLIWSVRRSSVLSDKKSISAPIAGLSEDSESAEDSEWTEKEISKFTPAWGNQVIAETHSEMLIYRLQRRIREGTLSPREVSILYVEPMDDGASVVRELRLRPDGTFIDEWPGGFFEDDFDEFFGESPDAHGVNETLSEEEGD
jgi:hypothetical protein